MGRIVSKSNVPDLRSGREAQWIAPLPVESAAGQGRTKSGAAPLPYERSPSGAPIYGHLKHQLARDTLGLYMATDWSRPRSLPPYEWPPIQSPMIGHLRSYPQANPITRHPRPVSTHLSTYERTPSPQSRAPQALQLATTRPIGRHLMPRKPASLLTFERPKGIKGAKAFT
jgi:hypothetical protein